jgi:N-acyl-D-amino-acid deacylase
MYDLLIKNGLLVDGTGATPVRGDLAMRGGLIVAVGGTIDGDAR